MNTLKQEFGSYKEWKKKRSPMDDNSHYKYVKEKFNI